MPMDVAQRWDICESVVYIILKYLWINVYSPDKNSDDRWFDYEFDYMDYDFRLQVKSVNISEITIVSDSIRYDLKVSNNNKLFQYSNSIPNRKSILMLIIVPEDERELVSLSEEDLFIKCQIYWLNSFQESDNSSTVTVWIPKENQICDSSNLSSLIERWLA